MKIERNSNSCVDYIGQAMLDDSSEVLFPRGYGIRWLQERRAASFSIAADGSKRFHVINRLSDEWPVVDRLTAISLVNRFEKTGEAVIV